MTDEIVNLANQLGDFKTKLTDELGKVAGNVKALSVEVKNLVAVQEKQNGHVTDLCKRMAAVELHPLNCIMKDKFDQLENILKTGDHIGSIELSARLNKVEKQTDEHLDNYRGRALASSRWKTGYLIPLVRWVTVLFLAAVLMLIGMHIEALIDKLGG